MHMAVKLVTETWREDKAEEKREFEAGEIAEDELCLDQLFPDQFIADTEPLLVEFAGAIAATNALDYDNVMNSIKSLVEKLNEINDKYNGEVIETGEREQLCQYIEDVISESAIDLDAYAKSMECDKNEITDLWREW